MKKSILLFFSLLAFELSAQNTHCATRLSEENLQWLRGFQAKLEQNGVPPASLAKVYVPIQVHIIGNNEGVGYYSITRLLGAMCDLNTDFEPSGMHFYLKGEVKYINDNELYNGNSDAIWFRAEDYKTPNAVNVFFHGAGMQWCGVYFPGVDVVFVKNSCQGPNATTFTHELGHFFSLPHTFSGWENDNIPANIERLDGSNCRSAGDGFCDTKADYVSQRWGCPLPWTLNDPIGAPFKPDSSMYMSYSSDVCQSRFSQEQMAAMNANLASRGISRTEANTNLLPIPKLIYPASKSDNHNPDAVQLEWNSVEGAYAYHLQIARFGDWNYLNYDGLVYDTTTIVKLFGTWEYAWRVRAITDANTCGSFGVADTFSTKEVPAGMVQLDSKTSLRLFPNPVASNERITLTTNRNTQVNIIDVQGNLVQSLSLKPNESFHLQLPTKGLYLLIINDQDNYSVQRVLVH